MRWKFKDLTNHKTLVVNIKDEILDGPLPRYVVSLREPDNENFDIVENLCKEGITRLIRLSYAFVVSCKKAGLNVYCEYLLIYSYCIV